MDGKQIFSITMQVPVPLALPVMTLPYPKFALAQPDENGNIICTAPGGRGFVKYARIVNYEADPRYFPDLSAVKPLAAVQVSNFKMTFPHSTTLEAKK
jgi:hypothetical protein